MMRKSIRPAARLKPSVIVVFSALGLAPLTLHAQTSVAAAADVPQVSAQPRDDMNTVVVTANRRREPVRDIPMQVNTIQAEQLQQSGATSLRDYMEMQPGITVNSKGSGALGDISIRGITTGSQITNTVGVYLDDAPATASGAAASGASFPLNLGLLDLHHIEVLRGPQGTLYGAGSMGGLLKYVTNAPNASEFSGTVRAGISKTEGEGGIGHTFGAILNVPLSTDVAALRISALEDKSAGYIRAVGGAARDRADRGDTRGARIALAFFPSKDLSLTATASTQQMHRDGIDLVDYDPVSRKPLFGQYAQEISMPQPIDKRDTLVSFNLEYNLGWGRFNAISSAARSHTFRQLDATVTTVDFLPFPATTAVDQQYLNTRKFTQEFRLTSEKGKSFDWLGGLFYTKETATNDQLGVCYQPGGSCPSLYNVALPSSYREIAAYGDITYHWTPRLDITGGLRIAHNTQSFSQISSGFYYDDVAAKVSTDSADTSRTYLLTAKYAIDKTSNVYARLATAYRPGGPNAVVPGAALKSTFDPDTSTSMELGYKADLAGKRVSVQADVFDINWKDIQQSYSLGGAAGVVNAGAARVQGAEASLTLRPHTDWTLNGSLSFIDAKLTEDAPGLGAHAGDRLPTSPRVAAALSARYRFEAMGHNANVAVTGRYTGDRLVHIQSKNEQLNPHLPAYGIVNLEGGVELGQFELNFFVRNLANKAGLASGTTSNIPLGGYLQFTVEQPRTTGAALTARF